MLIFLFKQAIGLVGFKPLILTSFLRVAVPMSVQFSEPLQSYSDLFCLCISHWPFWDLRSGQSIFQLKVYGKLFRVCCLSNMWVSPGFHKQYYGVALPSSSLSQISLTLSNSFLFLFLQPEIWVFFCLILICTFHAQPLGPNSGRTERENKIIRDEVSFPSELLGTYRLPWIGT